ncbi:hypothetical protein RHGRI_023477 [Rhododendron griersonianum]|uniref:Uncharacterized protein n=1 Tax=Rhododendron griersonianum TaxID=479676 RepID=A0AAV6J7I1_9ERIC|nr:hypothetical protein RHGRI_023477 [Rhododendron griersonianum]
MPFRNSRRPRNALNYYSAAAVVEGGEGGGDGGRIGSPVKGVGMAVTSRVKRELGLKMLRRSQWRTSSLVLGSHGGID